MTTYYDDRSVRITSETVRVHGRSYPLRGLTRVWTERGPRSWRAVAGRGAIVAALAGPIMAAALGLWIAIALNASLTVTIAVVGVACLTGLAAGPLADLLLDRMDRSYDRGITELRLWAEIGGRPVLLLRSRDALRFGQAHRALRRAVEQCAERRTAQRGAERRAIGQRLSSARPR
ncbi:DUF6232 family protein [Plantactinospora sp. GCM10030261]|uniref:DUF6232 family protein n=1 Tax=Plantactinospora sp. GCM10030261 TaxID=3273420 RepID=UPI00360DC3F7